MLSSKMQRRLRLLYVAVALSEIDHVTFHHLKFHQLCRVTRNGFAQGFQDSANGGRLTPPPADEEDFLDFQMLAFSKEGTFVTQWIKDEDRAHFRVTSPITIPSIQKVPFEDPVFADAALTQNQFGSTSSLNAHLLHAAQKEETIPSPEQTATPQSKNVDSALGKLENSDSKCVDIEEEHSSSSNPLLHPSEYIRSDNTIIEGRRNEKTKSTFCLVRVSDVCAFDLERMRHFLQQNMSETVENQLVFGAHGYGFALGVNVRVVRGDDDTALVEKCQEESGYYVSISLVDLVSVLEGMRFRSICFDCCLMSTAQTASAMHLITSYVVACEGYMWEEDEDIEKHVFNSHSARFLCFGVDGTDSAESQPLVGTLGSSNEDMPLTKALTSEGNQDTSIVRELIAVARHFSQNSPRGDIAVLNTEAGTLLYHHLLLSKAQLVPFLHRPASLTTYRPLANDITGPSVVQCSPLDSRDPEVGSFLYDIQSIVDVVAENVKEKEWGDGSIGTTSLTQEWVSKANQLLSATVLFSLPPGEKEGKYYTCGPLRGISVRI